MARCKIGGLTAATCSIDVLATRTFIHRTQTGCLADIRVCNPLVLHLPRQGLCDGENRLEVADLRRRVLIPLRSLRLPSPSSTRGFERVDRPNSVSLGIAGRTFGGGLVPQTGADFAISGSETELLGDDQWADWLVDGVTCLAGPQPCRPARVAQIILNGVPGVRHAVRHGLAAIQGFGLPCQGHSLAAQESDRQMLPPPTSGLAPAATFGARKRGSTRGSHTRFRR